MDAGVGSTPCQVGGGRVGVWVESWTGRRRIGVDTTTLTTTTATAAVTTTATATATTTITTTIAITRKS